MSRLARIPLRSFAPVLAAGLGLAGGVMVRALPSALPAASVAAAPAPAKAPSAATPGAVPASPAVPPAASTQTAPAAAGPAPAGAVGTPVASPAGSAAPTARPAIGAASASGEAPAAPASPQAAAPAASPASPAAGAGSGQAPRPSSAAGRTPAARAPAPRQPTASLAEKDIPLDLDLPAATKAKGRTPVGTLLWMLGFGLKLGLVLGLAYGSLHLLRRYLPGATRSAPAGEMGIRSSIPLGPGRSLHLIDVDGRRLLLASTSQQISLLTELPPAGAAQTPAPSDARATGDAEGFREHLQRLTAPDPRPEREAPAQAAEAAASGRMETETLSDDELREEVRRKLFSLNRSAEGIARLRESTTGGNGGTWRAR